MKTSASEYTPIMRQYLEIKAANPDALILFRLGDFYELFFDDAKLAARELDLYLTHRGTVNENKVPMCGVPYHAVNGYIAKLVAKGYKVGIVEQMEAASNAKGLVRRELVQLITPGTLIDVGLVESENNYLGALVESFMEYTLAYCDISTGEFYVLSLEKDLGLLISEITTLKIKEIAVDEHFLAASQEQINEFIPVIFSQVSNVSGKAKAAKLSKRISDRYQLQAIALLVNYLEESQKRELEYLKPVEVVVARRYMQLDASSRLSLELTQNAVGTTENTLFSMINYTQTAIGARFLRKALLRPLVDLDLINHRLDLVELLVNNYQLRKDLEAELNSIYDLERIIARIGYGSANARDLRQLEHSLSAALRIEDLIRKDGNPLLTNLLVKHNLAALVKLLDRALVEAPPITIKEGGIFQAGYSSELDALRQMEGHGQQFLSTLEQQERERTGIKTLKIAYNRVYGFYLEISKAAAVNIDPSWGYQRIQTLTTCERFKTPELAEKEDQILHAEAKALEYEYRAFLQLRARVSQETSKVQQVADFLAQLDFYYSLSTLAGRHRCCRPQFNFEQNIEIVGGRHLLLERELKEQFVPNDFKMTGSEQVMIITGPNMGGKSTIMRQQALLFILAQIGSFVPATSANLPLFDQIFTRIGASDDLLAGQSTFMVEMAQANKALRYATANSLLIFDEIGRGTSTYDGMALAQAIIEYIAEVKHCKTLFSTHYHLLTRLAETHNNIKNMAVQVQLEGRRIVFLYRLLPGAINRSYGINVAELAGLPEAVITKARHILKEFESEGAQVSHVSNAEVVTLHPVLTTLKQLDVNALSPLQALNILHHLKESSNED